MDKIDKTIELLEEILQEVNKHIESVKRFERFCKEKLTELKRLRYEMGENEMIQEKVFLWVKENLVRYLNFRELNPERFEIVTGDPAGMIFKSKNSPIVVTVLADYEITRIDFTWFLQEKLSELPEELWENIPPLYNYANVIAVIGGREFEEGVVEEADARGIFVLKIGEDEEPPKILNRKGFKPKTWSIERRR